MHQFKARLGNKTQSILVHKDMQTHEFTEALCYTMDLPDGHIIGFKDMKGKIWQKICDHQSRP